MEWVLIGALMAIGWYILAPILVILGFFIGVFLLCAFLYLVAAFIEIIYQIVNRMKEKKNGR